MKLYKTLPFLCLLLSVALNAQVPPPPPPDSVKMNSMIFTKVDIEATYPGGENAWRTFLSKNLNANIPVDNDAPSGKYTVIVKFVVSHNGSLSDIQAETNVGYGMEQEVLRIIKKSGNWNAAVQNKRTVNAYRRQPVTFVVEEDGFDIQTKVPYTLFTGVDNLITVDIKKVNNSNITLTISKGTITPNDNDQFIARVTEPGRVVITVYNKKNNKKLGAASFEVKPKN